MRLCKRKSLKNNFILLLFNCTESGTVSVASVNEFFVWINDPVDALHNVTVNLFSKVIKSSFIASLSFPKNL